MTIYRLGTLSPEIHKTAWIAPDANIIGSVLLREQTSIWFNSTLRGDNETIEVGAGSNIQENTVMHTDAGYPIVIGDGCTIGHKAILHGCVIGSNTLIGMGAIVLNGAKIGNNCLIGAGALITENKVIPDGSLVMGSPGKIVRELNEQAFKGLAESAVNYQDNAARFVSELKEISDV